MWLAGWLAIGLACNYCCLYIIVERYMYMYYYVYNFGRDHFQFLSSQSISVGSCVCMYMYMYMHAKVHLRSLVASFFNNIIYNFINTGQISFFFFKHHFTPCKLVNLLIPLRSSYDIPFVNINLIFKGCRYM